MYIHKITHSRTSMGGVHKKVARHHKRTMGSGLKEEIFEDHKVHRATDTLRNLRVSKPRVPRQYISFD